MKVSLRIDIELNGMGGITEDEAQEAVWVAVNKELKDDNATIGMAVLNEEEGEETVIVDKETFEAVCEDSAFLNALRAAGVDNWSGYGEAWRILDEEL